MIMTRTTDRLTLGDIMTRKVVTVGPEDTLREVIETLAEQHVAGAPVMSNGTIVGVISRTDILDFLAATPPVPTETPHFVEWGEFEYTEAETEGDEQSSSFYTDLWDDAGADVVERFAEAQGPEWDLLSEYTASAVMTAKLETLPPHATLDDAARRMLARGVHRLLVVENEKLEGVVSMTDLVRLIATGALRNVG
jgi:CBS domain-containing protein